MSIYRGRVAGRLLASGSATMPDLPGLRADAFGQIACRDDCADWSGEQPGRNSTKLQI